LHNTTLKTEEESEEDKPLVKFTLNIIVWILLSFNMK
jgi:hypothetical protein